MLMIVDNEEFYEQQKPLSIKDIKLLVVILKQALWQLLWIIPASIPLSQRSISDLSGHKKLTVEIIKDRAKIVISELLSQWRETFETWLKEAIWSRTGYASSIEEYLEKEAKDGKLNLVLLYLRENPTVNIEKAITQTRSLLDAEEKTFLEHVKSIGYSGMLCELKELHLSCLKTFQIFYNSSNAFNLHTALLKNINMAIYEPH